MDYVNLKEKPYFELNRKSRDLGLSSLLRYETRKQRLQRHIFLMCTIINNMNKIKDIQNED